VWRGSYSAEHGPSAKSADEAGNQWLTEPRRAGSPAFNPHAPALETCRTTELLSSDQKGTRLSGLNIHCGSFQGEDKSGSALEGVLAALSDAPSGLIDSIKLGFENDKYVLVSEEQVRLLLPLLVSYRKRLIADIGHEDWWKEAVAEDDAGLNSVKAKWGAGRGWRLYCVTDLIRACETSMAEHEPIAIVLS
jgi:hypothetical protein